MKLLRIEKATDGIHKYRAVFDNDGRSRTTQFGASGYDDFLHTHDLAQRDRYRTRHAKDLKGDATRAGYLSYYILWGDTTSLHKNIASYKHKFNL